MNKKPNIILMTIDSLRPDFLGFMGHPGKITPNLDQLAQESIIFKNAYSVGPVTPHSFPGILTSNYPFDFCGPTQIKPPRILISQVLKNCGYLTAAFHSNGYLTDFFGYNQGWDIFEDITLPADNLLKTQDDAKKWLIPLKTKETIIKMMPSLYFRKLHWNYLRHDKRKYFKIRAPLINNTVKDYINVCQKNEKPFFAWIHYMDIHTPYRSISPPEKNKRPSFHELAFTNYASLMARSPKSLAVPRLIKKGLKYACQAIKFYQIEIQSLDKAIGSLIRFLKKKRCYHNTLLILTSDHGDEFMEHNGGSHSSQLYNELLHVPLIIKLIQHQKQIIKHKTSLIHLAPTICSLLNIKTPSSFKGSDLFSSKPELIFHQTVSETVKKQSGEFYVFGINQLNQLKMACQSSGWKYIKDFGCQSEELYWLARDPREQKNLALQKPRILFEMRGALEEFQKKNPPFSHLKKIKTNNENLNY